MFAFRNRKRTFKLAAVYFERLILRGVERVGRSFRVVASYCRNNSKRGVHTELTMNFAGRNHLPFRQLSALCTDIITYASALLLIVLGC